LRYSTTFPKFAGCLNKFIHMYCCVDVNYRHRRQGKVKLPCPLHEGVCGD